MRKILGYSIITMMVSLVLSSLIFVMLIDSYVSFYRSKVLLENKSVANSDITNVLFRLNKDMLSSGVFGCYSLRRQATLISGGMTSLTRDNNITRSWADKLNTILNEGGIDYLDNGLLVLSMNSFVEYTTKNKLNYLVNKFSRNSNGYTYSFGSGDLNIDDNAQVMRIQYGINAAHIKSYSPEFNRLVISGDSAYSILNGSNLTKSAKIIYNNYQPYLNEDIGLPPVYASCNFLFQSNKVNLNAGTDYFAQLNHAYFLQHVYSSHSLALNTYVVYYLVGTKTYNGVSVKGLYAIPIVNNIGSEQPILLSNNITQVNYKYLLTYKISNDNFIKQEIQKPDYIIKPETKLGYIEVIPARMITGIGISISYKDDSRSESTLTINKQIDL